MVHATKILVKIICNRIENKEIELINRQFGFRRTRESILSLRILVEKQIEFSKAFIDSKKALDNIPRKEFFQTLDEIEPDYRGRRIIYNLYKD